MLHLYRLRRNINFHQVGTIKTLAKPLKFDVKCKSDRVQLTVTYFVHGEAQYNRVTLNLLF